jgi:hypothetical protein
MTCRIARRRLADLLDGEDAELRAHLATCGRCAAEYEETLNALARIQPGIRIEASAGFKERTMSRLAEEQIPARTKPGIFETPFRRLALTAAVVLAIVLALPYAGTLGTNRGAVALLAQSVQAAGVVQSVHIVARMRTPPGDNFEYIDPSYDFQPVEMWKQFGSVPRLRVENPGRVVVMDGKQSILYMKPDRVVRGGPHAGFIDWLKPLLDPEQILAGELRSAQRSESRAGIQHEGARITLTATRKAVGEYFLDWGRNRMLSDSDQTRVYQFDAGTSRLTALQVMLHDSGREVVVFETLSVRYNETLSDALFTVALPDHVIADVPPERMPVNGALPVTARDAAAAFLEGLSYRDWNRVLTVYPAEGISEGLKKSTEGMVVISIGEPFRSGLYAGWFVPYEVQFADGTRKHWNLAVRNDNAAHRWVQDGGF